jgi:hypothetical protein
MLLAPGMQHLGANGRMPSWCCHACATGFDRLDFEMSMCVIMLEIAQRATIFFGFQNGPAAPVQFITFP